jgi:hypothetical protein
VPLYANATQTVFGEGRLRSIRTSDSPFARAFFELAEGLDIVDLDSELATV